jgi:7-cyano-7-deazaguanine synthase
LRISKSPSSPVSAVLLSGGLDSAVLVAEEAQQADVQPIYVSVGLAWETAERRVVDQLMDARAMGARVRPVARLVVDTTDVYPSAHWAMRGAPPGYHTPDEDVYLPGRNIVLLSKAAIYCAAAGIGRIVIGTLDHNPFPDASPAFRQTLAAALSLGLAHAIAIDAPYASVSKAEVIRRGARLGVALGLTLSCMNPVATPSTSSSVRHCGLCSKCRERHDAFLEAGVADPTDYADLRYVSA